MHLRSRKKSNISNLFAPAKEKPFSILENAKKILTALKDNAEKVREVKDFGNEHGTEEELQQFMLTHTVSVTFAETGLSQAHFYAATDLINSTEWILLCQKLKKQLDLYVVNVESKFAIGIKNTDETTPPVLIIPFAEMIASIEKMANLLFSNWHLADDAEYLERVIKSPEERRALLHAVKLVEESYGEIVDKFKFDIKCAYDSDVIKINKEQLNNVKTLFTGEPLMLLDAYKKMKP